MLVTNIFITLVREQSMHEHKETGNKLDGYK